MEKAAHIIMYVFGGGTLVAVVVGLAAWALDFAPYPALYIAFGIGAVAGFFGGLQRKFE